MKYCQCIVSGRKKAKSLLYNIDRPQVSHGQEAVGVTFTYFLSCDVTCIAHLN